jgi:hypothetical protein
VNWRFGGGYSGWGPIGWRGEEIVYPGYHYCYVDNAHFAEVNFREYRVPPERIVVVERDARPMPTRYANGHVVVSVNAGPPRAEIEHASGHSIRPVPMAQVAKQQHMMPPASAKGVHYSNGASPSHPFVAQKVQATNRPPPAGGAGHPEGGGAHPMEGGRPEGGARPEGNSRPEGNARPEGGGRPAQNERPAARPAEGGGEQRPEAHPAGGERPEQHEQAHPAAPAAKPAAKPKPAPQPVEKKKKP